ncbi:hypothetical protein DEIPH_ctg041orf0013 [Deinococcus phoenicis]|uniref:Uncharacterized protein n=1 Tax=Deinococcus phoenicis TaxID=1476583 RepID=A0A016QNF8_9DEIO|nr:hypothetical protein [Deinococcus phoenicis]EYB67417.1 hypothetical protein DEIPH_ctg041orf0013 [Deinococcus phoenicis]
MLYLRDRAMRDYHFMKVDKKALAEADLSSNPDPVDVKARERFLSVYDLPEYRSKKITKRAAQDLKRALKKRRVPAWVLAVAPPLAEIEELAGEK